MMIDIDVKVRRWFWQGVTPKAVDIYLKDLDEAKARLKEFDFEYRHLLLGGKMAQELTQSIDREITYCKFYQEYNARVESEPELNRWVFRAKEEIVQGGYATWNTAQGEQWTKTNGRIRATIQYDRSGFMVKLTLSYANDSESLEFHNSYDRKTVVYRAKKLTSIQAKASLLKQVADAYLRNHMLPRYEGIMSQLSDLRKLLCIENAGVE